MTRLRRGLPDPHTGDSVVVGAPEQLDEVVTPALLVDRDRLLTNIQEMAARARSLGVALRPHAKTHKSPAIAALQRQHGATGLTVATVTEAEGFAAQGVDDLVLTAPPVGDWRLERVLALARRVRIRVVVDNVDVVAQLKRACRRAGVELGYLWEVDCGVGRFGTLPGAATAELVAHVAAGASHASFDGLLTFGGHAYAATSRDGIVAAARDEREAIVDDGKRPGRPRHRDGGAQRRQHADFARHGVGRRDHRDPAGELRVLRRDAGRPRGRPARAVRAVGAGDRDLTPGARPVDPRFRDRRRWRRSVSRP